MEPRDGNKHVSRMSSTAPLIQSSSNGEVGYGREMSGGSYHVNPCFDEYAPPLDRLVSILFLC